MSYTILYRSMFVKVDNNRFIPLYESGDNNVWECDLSRRARSWGHYYPCNLRKDHKTLPFFTEHELLGLMDGDLKQCVYYGVKVSGISCTQEKDLMNYWRRGIKKAKTFDELEAAGITLQVKDCNYGDERPHFSKSVHNLAELIMAWTICLQVCGTAECVPYGSVSEWAFKRLYPKKPKIKVAKTVGFVVQFGYRYVEKMTPRHLHYTAHLEYAFRYATRNAAEKVVQRIKARWTQISETPVVVPVRKNENDRWEQAA